MTGRRPSGGFLLPAHRLPRRFPNRLGCRSEIPLRRRDAGVSQQLLDPLGQSRQVQQVHTATARGSAKSPA